HQRGTEGRMAVTVLIPTPLRPFVGGRDAVELEAGSVGELLDRLTGQHAELKPHLFATDGRLRSFVNVYVNDRDIRQLAQRETPVRPGDTVSIIPSIAGGTATQVGAQHAAPLLPKLSHEEILRYSRHLILPDVGVEGQKKLKAARVLLVGAGGLGSPAALYLAAAGVGTLGLVDFDVVDQTNLQRQILHGTSAVGTLKLESARARIQDLNPNVQVETFETRLTSENALQILREFGVGEPLIGRLLLFDALKLQFRELKLEKDPDCPVCGRHPTITELIDYEAFCGIGAEPVYDGADVTADAVKRELDAGRELVLLDV